MPNSHNNIEKDKKILNEEYISKRITYESKLKILKQFEILTSTST